MQVISENLRTFSEIDLSSTEVMVQNKNRKTPLNFCRATLEMTILFMCVTVFLDGFNISKAE